MKWLNYHHLYYFWTIAHEGSISKASQTLKLSQPTLSSQIHLLEESLGRQLFKREGRGLVLSETGRFVLKYADEIFKLGSDLLDSLEDRSEKGVLRIQVGITDVVPKLVSQKILSSIFESKLAAKLSCYEDTPDDLLIKLAAHHLDVVISDAPVSSKLKIKAHSHLLFESEAAVFGPKKYKKYFLKSEQLKNVPFLLPNPESETRRQIDVWFNRLSVKPHVIAECDDTSLIKTLAQKGSGCFFAPISIEKNLKTDYGLTYMMTATGLKKQYYAITVDRKIKHPLVQKILSLQLS